MGLRARLKRKSPMEYKHHHICLAAVMAAMTACGIPQADRESLREAAPAVTVTVTDEVTVTPEAMATAKAPKPQTRMGEGSWIIGEDYPAGTYRTVDAISGMCYWGIYRGGSNQEDILQNDIVRGGKPRVTLRKGQEFDSSGCGEWEKVK